MSTNPNVTVSNFDIGPCQVTFNNTDLGGTSGNVKITFKYEKAAMMADQTGKTTLDMAISGMSCQVQTNFLEVLNKVNLQKAFPSLDLGGSSPHQYLDLHNKVGTRQIASASPLILHPLNVDQTDADLDYYFWLALPSEDSEITKGPGEQVAMKLLFNILLDTSVSPYRLFRYGDHSL